ncbi:DNA polymerase III subunit beta [Ensifer sp. ZNC0028]|uniref:DNA polymerase III subunit beta n=1 Tax=Ensifer sp. ZNC0028 TaxID=1339236 RepID=UPI0005B9CB6A|nr:DNA polymerase III subunit beta [Ensifer sp. ZNC0028]
MKLETTARILKSALTVVGRVVDKRTTMPILAMVKFADGAVTGTDLDNEISVKLPASGFEGAACLPLHSLARLVAHLAPDELVRISGDGNGSTISFSSGRYDLPSIDAGDFPVFSMAEPQPIALDGDRLKKAVTFVAPFISNEETRYYLNGVHISEDAAVATDGHRLGWHALGFEGGAFGKAILPRRLVETLIASPPPKSAAMDKAGSRVAFEMEGMSVRSRLIDGLYPDYRRVIPSMSENAARLVVDRQSLLRTMARIAALRKRYGADVTLAWDDARLAVATKFSDGEATARETLSVLRPSTGGTSTYNCHYLAAAMRCLRSEVVNMFCEDGRSPSVWRCDEDSMIVLMPMRGSNEDIATSLLTSLQAGNRLDAAA